ncbi:MAG: alpha/beta hydrolase, partial [Rickettsiales bacterium]
MFDIKISEFNQYEKEYKKFAHENKNFKYLSNINLVDNDIYNSEIADLLFYKSSIRAGKIFLITPSIFNSPEILFISKENNFIENLLQQGDVYLINWKETNRQLVIKDLVNELENIIQVINKYTNRKINLIGHCIGGNICLGVADNNISSLTLLTTPWDFSHLQKFTLMRDNLELINSIADMEKIPKLYIQIIFFLMFPMQFNNKIQKYFTLPLNFREIFLCTEHWLQSGIDIPRALLEDIINNFCVKNVCVNKEWKLEDRLVDIESLTVPTCIIYAD